MKVLVTGAAGFIGSRVGAALNNARHSVVRFDRTHGKSVVRMSDLTSMGKVDACIHLAGVLGTAELFDDPHTAVDVNITGTLNVLEYCRAVGAQFVGITMPKTTWKNIYTATKHCAADLATTWHLTYGVPVSHVRAFNAFGPRQKVGIPRKIIPTFSVAALKGEPLEVWGSGLQTVDLVYVDDIAKVLVEALRCGGNDETFDAGTKTSFSVNDVAKMAIEITGSSSEIIHSPMRLGEDPDTQIAAEGEGWDKLSFNPTFRMEDLRKTVLSYQKTCTKCGQNLTLDVFPTVSHHANGYESWCKKCKRAQIKGKRAENPDAWRDQYLRRTYSISLEDYNVMVERQGGVCGVTNCGVPPEDCTKGVLVVDHDHSCCPGAMSCGRCVRGLVCDRCNTGLSMFKDDSEVLRGAASYLDLNSVKLLSEMVGDSREI